MSANNQALNRNDQPYMHFRGFNAEHTFAETVAQVEKNYYNGLAQSRKGLSFQKNPEQAMNNYNLVNVTGYMRAQSRKLLEREMNALGEENRTRVNEFIIQHWNQYRLSENEPAPASANELDLQKVRDIGLGDGLTQVMEINRQDELNHELQYEMINPKSDFRDRSRNVDFPYAQRIQELKSQIAEDDPQRQEKLRTLDKANDSTAVVKKEVMDYYDQVDVANPRAGLPRITDALDDFYREEFSDFMDTYQDGQLVDTYPQRMANNKKMYDSLIQKTGIGGNNYKLTSQQELQVRSFKPQLSQEVKDMARAFFAEMDAIGEQNFRTQNSLTGREFRAEQGNKLYGFTPIVVAKSSLKAAIQEGDMEKIATAQAEYDRIKEHTDKLMDLARKHKVPIFSGNVNSTRSQSVGDNDVPDEYVKDYTDHNIVNGMYCLWAFCKNRNLTVDQVLDDPSASFGNAAREKQRQTGIASHGTIAGQLCWGLSRDAAFAQNSANQNDQFLLGRGMTTLGAFCSPEERKQLIAAGEFANLSANVAVRREQDLWQALGKADDVTRRCLYEQAALLPEDEFDIIALQQEIQENDGQPLSLEQTITRLRNEGHLDLGKLAQRTQQVMNGADQEIAVMNSDQVSHFSNYLHRDFIASSLKAYRKVLETANLAEQGKDGYYQLKDTVAGLEKKLLDSVLKMEDGNQVSEALQSLDTNLTAVKQRKEGFGFLAPNSPEHQRMTQAVTRLNNKFKLIQGQPVPELSEEEIRELSNADLNTELRKAREATYEYYRLKTKNGTKESFSVGYDRQAAAFHLIESLDVLQDKFKARTAAESVLQTNQRVLMYHANDQEWLAENAPRKAAEMMVAMHEVYLHPGNDDKQAKVMSNLHLKSHTDVVMGTPAFQQLVQDVPVEKLAEKMIVGRGQLTDAYITAKNTAENVQGAKSAQEMTYEEKTNLWKEHDIGPVRFQ